MRTTVIQPAELGASERATWRSFQQAQPELGNPFLAPELTVAAGKVRPGTRVAILEDAGEIIGFFPFERRAFGYGLPVAPGLTDCQGVVHAPDADWNAHDLLRSCGLGVWEFDRLVDGQKPFEPFQVLRAPAPIIDLSNGSAALLADLRRRSSRVAEQSAASAAPAREGHRPAALRIRNTGIQRNFGSSWRGSPIQYRRTGRTDRFARPWVRRFVSDLLDLRSPHFTLVLSVLYAGDQPVAAHLGLRRGGVMAGWFPAYDPHFAKYSPGLLHRLHLIEAAAASGVRLIEMGRGTYEHKELFKTRDVMVGEGRVVRLSGSAALYYTGRAPLRRLRQTVTDSPELYRAADTVLTRYGRLHSALTVRAEDRPQGHPS